mgnify:CR=1 FL=1
MLALSHLISVHRRGRWACRPRRAAAAAATRTRTQPRSRCHTRSILLHFANAQSFCMWLLRCFAFWVPHLSAESRAACHVLCGGAASARSVACPRGCAHSALLCSVVVSRLATGIPLLCSPCVLRVGAACPFFAQALRFFDLTCATARPMPLSWAIARTHAHSSSRTRTQATVESKAPASSSSAAAPAGSSRIRFMLEAIYDVKNNKRRLQTVQLSCLLPRC